jgi:hypothetical protein
MANTLAYCGTVLTTAVKRFKDSDPRTIKICVATFLTPFPFSVSLTKEYLLKGKAQYRSPPNTNKLRSAAAFDTAYIIYICTIRVTLMRRSTVLSYSLLLVFHGLTSSMTSLVENNGDKISMLDQRILIEKGKL